jgi:hypothetical protein
VELITTIAGDWPAHGTVVDVIIVRNRPPLIETADASPWVSGDEKVDVQVPRYPGKPGGGTIRVTLTVAVPNTSSVIVPVQTPRNGSEGIVGLDPQATPHTMRSSVAMRLLIQILHMSETGRTRRESRFQSVRCR